jgi:GNAT superfamily N-acetyltransferase
VLFVHERTGWLGFAAMLPRHRGRGGQHALLAARIDEARSAGCELLVTETGERLEGRPSASCANILRAGFREAYLRPNWTGPRRAGGRAVRRGAVEGAPPHRCGGSGGR